MFAEGIRKLMMVLKSFSLIVVNLRCLGCPDVRMPEYLFFVVVCKSNLAAKYFFVCNHVT